MPLLQTYETSDFATYVAYMLEANRENPYFVPASDPTSMERVLLKAPSYNRSGHFLALDGGRIVADAIALERTAGGQRLGLLQCNALPDHRNAATFKPLLESCLGYLVGKVDEVRLYLRPEHAAARKPLQARGFEASGAVARLSGPISSARGGRAIHAMRPDELPTVVALLTNAFREDPAFSLVTTEGLFGMAVLRDSASGAYFVAERDDRPVGAVGVGLRGEDGLVDFIAVHPEYRRAGVGSGLLSTALFWMSQRGCHRAFAVADAANEAAMEFYRRFGFAVSEPEHRIQYRKIIV